MDPIWPIGVCAILLTLATFVPLLKFDHWIIRSMDFPRLQIMILLSIIMLIALTLLDLTSTGSQVLLSGMVIASIYQLTWIIPYSRLCPKEVQTTTDSPTKFSITLLSTNVLMTNRNSDQVLTLIGEYKPDIIVTLETNHWWQTQLEVLEKSYPYKIQCALENLYGMHVYSTLELKNPEIKFLVEDDKPSMHAAIMLPDGKQARLHFLHPAPPSPTENETSSERDAELLVLAKELKNTSEPTIVAGDLNDVAWSRTTRAFRQISGLLDPRIGRGTFNTFHTGYWFLRWPLDHLFISHHFTLSRMVRLRSIGSDHFPLLSTIDYCPDNHQQPNASTSKGQEQWASAKIDGEDVNKEDIPDPTKK